MVLFVACKNSFDFKSSIIDIILPYLFSVLYRIGPPFFHGSYSVIVRPVHEGSFTDVEEYTDRKLTWTTFCGLHRVTEHVAKVSGTEDFAMET